MATNSADGATDLGPGMGILFGLLVAVAGLVSMLTDGILHSLGFGAAVLFGVLLVVSLHVYD
ncbi:MAG: hypothetical protein ABEJ55_00075 [Halanaeroarchaeum sp.]